MTHHLWYMASKISVLLNTLLFYQCFDDIWTTIWCIVQICAVFQNESCEIVIKQRILQKKRGIHCSQIFTFFVVAESGWTGVFYRLGMLPRPRTPSPSACCGNGCNPCVMDLHQQVGTKCGIFCVKTWDRQKIYRTGSGDVGKRKWGVRGEVHKCSKTSTFELHRVWGGHKS